MRSLLTGVGPATGAIAVFFIFKIKPVMNLKGNYQKLVFPFLFFWFVPIVLISGIAYVQKGTFPWLTIFAILIYGLFEEIGWRGFLYQELKPLRKLVNILIVATLWFIWHLNFEITPLNILFYGILILGSWGIGKVADSTNSLLAVSAFHSLNNFFPNLDQTKIAILSTLITIWIAGLVIRKRMQKNAA